MTVYDFTVKGGDGKDVCLSKYAGKVLMIVNTATGCGLTPQFDSIQDIYEKYGEHGFAVLDFPCNQFLGQAPGTDEEIDNFCKTTYGTTFPRFAKINVNGENAEKLYVWLKEQAPTDKGNAATKAFEENIKQFTQENKESDIKWNFGKFLVDRDGNVVSRYSPAYLPEALGKDIEELLELPQHIF